MTFNYATEKGEVNTYMYMYSRTDNNREIHQRRVVTGLKVNRRIDFLCVNFFPLLLFCAYISKLKDDFKQKASPKSWKTENQDSI